ncbi:MAG: hypothetical protein HY617_01815 [Candidatus Sungbacteria bacterium]|nr:hypothetical protein [Candidatus Sungbacteria bacterium]
MTAVHKKNARKSKAIILRKRGLSYREIVEHVPVARSMLSVWLRDVKLTKKHRHRLIEKQRLSALRGAASRRKQRILRTEEIHRAAAQEITGISDRELWLMGIMLYWAEGGQEREERPGSGVWFSSSDPYMVKVFLKWLLDVCKVPGSAISFEVTIQGHHNYTLDHVVKYWAYITGFEKKDFSHVYFRQQHAERKKKRSAAYQGVLKIKVKESSALNRKITGWIRAIYAYYFLNGKPR